MSGWAYIEGKNLYGDKNIVNFLDDTLCKTWFNKCMEFLLAMGFSKEEIKEVIKEEK